MELKDIIKIFEKVFNKTLILKRELILEPTFKAYKTYRITLFEFTTEKEIKDIITTLIRDKIVDSNKEVIISNVEKQFLEELIRYYVSTRNE